ncbi:hypothetical protein CC1G_15773 [Coprinopsis cinerea okayama7|uniref:Uncharacterized protein n=1 Tax=Coprinopsis cinerea (strain Okayama-7 / 130 / ATCC MYA-4618 / FGSC 9003) TaxID=240176 RepID=D6RR16_COPC7|nr:hypothetical protein CC1G_15773 [Coprinopsis cinerea okayama7\|eukprot:XP_002910053.1 hypothetical protein CC1G_15773 [Coprinopsis cinerea okayama7\
MPPPDDTSSAYNFMDARPSMIKGIEHPKEVPGRPTGLLTSRRIRTLMGIDVTTMDDRLEMPAKRPRVEGSSTTMRSIDVICLWLVQDGRDIADNASLRSCGKRIKIGSLMRHLSLHLVLIISLFLGQPWLLALPLGLSLAAPGAQPRL